MQMSPSRIYVYGEVPEEKHKRIITKPGLNLTHDFCWLKFFCYDVLSGENASPTAPTAAATRR